jgi:NADH-quinone oxidoreductase subunit L
VVLRRALRRGVRASRRWRSAAFSGRRATAPRSTGSGPDGIAARAQDIAGVLSRFQSGYLYHYAFVMLVGVAALVTYFMLFVR